MMIADTMIAGTIDVTTANNRATAHSSERRPSGRRFVFVSEIDDREGSASQATC